MRIELLVVPGCPHERIAAQRLRRALDEIGLTDTDFTTRAIATQAEAEQVGFPGSLTILVDGRDPFAVPGGAPALACRIYRTSGGTQGAPDLAQLRQVLQSAH